VPAAGSIAYKPKRFVGSENVSTSHFLCEKRLVLVPLACEAPFPRRRGLATGPPPMIAGLVTSVFLTLEPSVLGSLRRYRGPELGAAPVNCT
jgi:hypothetical protein